MDPHIQKRNRRSRRLQKKNSLDVQFRRRFSMLRDGNAGVVNINKFYLICKILPQLIKTEFLR